MEPTLAVRQAREAIARGAWSHAFRRLAMADRATSLSAPDLERLATAAYMLGRTEDHLNYLKRAHAGYRDAADGLRAARCALWAGISLAIRGKSSHASGWFGRAQRLVDRERDDCVERGYLLIPTLLQCAAGRDWNAAADVAARAVAIAERFDDADLFALAAHERGHALVQLGRVEDGLRLFDEVMVSVTAGELSPMVTGLVYCSVIGYCQDMFQLERAQAWTRSLADWCGQQPEMVAHTGQCLVHRAEVMHMRGAWRDALIEARHAKERFLEATNPVAAGRALYWQAEVYRLRGKFEAAESAYRDAARFGYEPEPGLALLRLAQGRTAASAETIRRAVAETTDELKRARLLPACVEIMLAAGNHGEARAACVQLEEMAKDRHSSLLDALAAQSRGAVDLAEGNPGAALGTLRLALEAWQALEAPYEAARARVLIAQACRALQDKEAAELELGIAGSVFSRLHAGADITRVSTLLRNVASMSAHGLTPRELGVLRHVATGKSNKTIARDLGLSERTVDRHVSNIFDKLGVSSRAAATAFACRNQLV